jgi:hypothetical protein
MIDHEDSSKNTAFKCSENAFVNRKYLKKENN